MPTDQIIREETENKEYRIYTDIDFYSPNPNTQVIAYQCLNLQLNLTCSYEVVSCRDPNRYSILKIKK